MVETLSYGPRRRLAGGTMTYWFGYTEQQPEWGYGYGNMNTTKSPGPPYVAHNNWSQREVENRPGAVNWNHWSQTYRNWLVSPVAFNEAVYTPDLPLQSVVNAALASVNPSKPVFQLGTFLWELREFPSMLMDLGHILSIPRTLRQRAQGYHDPDRSVAIDPNGQYLAYQFGWSPLINDLRTLWNLGTEIDAVTKRLASVRKRKRASGTYRSTNSRLEKQAYLPSFGTLRATYQVDQKIWWTAHWIADETPHLPFSVAQSYDLATALGSKQPYSQIWAALPWSFVIDYFLKVSTFLEAAEGLQTYRPDAICVMNEFNAHQIDSGFDESFQGSYTPGAYHQKCKNRVVVHDPVPGLNFEIHPVADKMHLLGALATAQAMRGHSSSKFSPSGG